MGTLTVNAIREVTSTMDVVAKIAKGDARVRDTPVQMERVFESLCRRCEACINADYCNFKHLLLLNHVFFLK